MKQSNKLSAYGLAFVASTAIVFAACSGGLQQRTAQPAMPQVGVNSADGSVVKSRAIIHVTTNSAGQILAAQVQPTPRPSTSATQSIEVTNAANTSMTMDNSGWIVPTIDNSVIDFGSLAINSLMDNNLNACGAAGNEHCGAAIVRAYTINKPGAGVWNDVDQFGAPLLASFDGVPAANAVGLNAEGAVVLQTLEIAPSKHVLRLEDFIPAPVYAFQGDFTDAGAGTYSATLVIEYVLASSMPVPTPSPTVIPEPAPTVTPDPTPVPVPTISPVPLPLPLPTPSFLPAIR